MNIWYVLFKILIAKNNKSNRMKYEIMIKYRVLLLF